MTISSVGGKSADAFRTISEVAEALKLPQHVLRFWETRFAQIKPMKRAGGRRFYRPEDVELLGSIRQLLYGEGYTIKGVQRILKEQGPRAVAALARRHEADPDAAVFDIAAHDGEPDGEDELEPPPAAPAAESPPPFWLTGDAAPPRQEEAGSAVEALRAVLEELAACRALLDNSRH